jgi:hypothetical protein
MNKCDNLADNCKQKTCNNKNPITINDINKFFDSTDECSTSIVYLNRYNDGITLSKLYVKNIDEECNIFFTIRNDYYYIYPKFMENIILWSKHPKAFGSSGYLGNHISIGEKNGDIDIHETTYNSKISNNNHILIASKNHINYKIQNDKLVAVPLSQSDMQLKAQILWDDIRCYNKTNIGGGKKLNLVKPGTKSKVLLSFKEKFNIILNRCKNIKKLDNKDHIIRIPYIIKSELILLSNKILKNTDLNISIIISDSHAKTSIAII